jgi:hypothetical protein
MTVFLRPNPASVPVDYQRQVGGSGLIVFPQRQLAIYTMKAAPAVGPQGPPGEDQNSWYDTIIAAVTDHTNPSSVGWLRESWRAPYPLDLSAGYIRMSLIDAPTGADFIVDVHMNGATMFSTLLRIDANEKTSVTSAIPAVLSTTYVPDDAEFTVYISQVGSTLSGIGLKIAVTGIKTT